MTDDLEALRFNRAVAQIYTLANAIAGCATADGAVRREALEALVLLIGPMMPHLAETCWEALGHTTLVADTPWPKADPALTQAGHRHHRGAGERQAARRRRQFAGPINGDARQRCKSSKRKRAIDGRVVMRVA